MAVVVNLGLVQFFLQEFFLCWTFHECMLLSCTMLNCGLDIILGANWPHGPFDDNENVIMELMNLSLHLITLFTPMFCQCAPPWLPLYPLFELKQSIKKILLIVIESFFDLILFPTLWGYWDSRTYWSWPNIIFTTFFLSCWT